jgi:ABC-type multidrug transport system fused ATPase/permease subunit
LDSVNRSPIYALLGESVDGVAVIRAFSAEESLLQRLTSMLDTQQHAYYLTTAGQSWLAVRLELIGTLIITFACLSAVFQHAAAQSNDEFAGLAGLAISYALSVTQSLNWSVRMASDMEANMVSVERVNEYTSIESEGSRHTHEDEKLSDWPAKGEIVFQGAKLRYRPGLPLVLKGLDIHIPAGSKVGVVGRTGAGKVCIYLLLHFIYYEDLSLTLYLSSQPLTYEVYSHGRLDANCGTCRRKDLHRRSGHS